MAPQRRGVRQSPCFIFYFWTIFFCDVSKKKKTYKNFGIGMYLSIPSRDILSPKSKYSTGFDVQLTL